MKMQALVITCALAMAGTCRAGTVYLDKNDWLAALNGATPTNLSLTAQTGLTTASTVSDDELTLGFNTGRYSASTSGTGWGGVIDSLFMSSSTASQADFASPLYAFGTTMMFEDALTLTLDSSYSYTHVPGPPGTMLQGFIGTPHFFGWIGDPTSTLKVSGSVVLSSYSLSNVQYLTSAVPAHIPVPLPPAVVVGLPLLGLSVVAVRRGRRASAR